MFSSSAENYGPEKLRIRTPFYAVIKMTERTNFLEVKLTYLGNSSPDETL